MAYAAYYAQSKIKKSLIIAGSEGWKIKIAIPAGLRGKITVKKNVSEEEKSQLYQNAFAFIFPRKLEKILPCSQIRFDRSSLQTRCCDSNKMKRFGEIWEIRDIGRRRILSGWRLPAKPFNFLRRLLHEDWH